MNLIKKHPGGFTLVELMVVIAIIALLTGIVMSNFTSSKAKSRDAQRVADLAQIQLSLALYFDRCNQYPAAIADTSAANGCPTGITLGSYIGKIPTPPTGANPAQASYGYGVNNSTTPTDYILYARLEAANDSATKNGISTGAYSQTCSSASGSLDYCVGPK